jgi:hypothetical protein
MHPTHPRRRPWPSVLLLVVTALLVALAAVVVVAPPAGAHSLGGTEPSNYQTRVLGLRPAVAGVSVEVVDAGTRLRLHNGSDREVVVLGYQSEPWLRVGPGQSVTWHDHRAHWEAGEPPANVRQSPGSAQVAVPRWTVKLRTGRRLVDVVGDVRWVPGPSPLPWLAGAAVLTMAVVAASRGRRWLGALVAALALLVTLDLVQLAGAWIGASPPLAGKLLSLGTSAAGWVLAALAVRQLLRRRLESGLFQLLLAAGLLTLVSGLGDLGFLLRSQLASSLPDQLVRAAVAAKLGLGAGALTAAALHLRTLLSMQATAPTAGRAVPAARVPAAGTPAGASVPAAGTPAGTAAPWAVPAGAVDNHQHLTRPSATLPHRGGRYRRLGLKGAPWEGTPWEGTPWEGTPWEGTPWEGTRSEGTRSEGDQSEGVQLWDDERLDFEEWDDPDLLDERFAASTRVPELHVVGGRASRRPEPATAAPSSTSATVLPWPSHRRPGTVFDDPDLPGGA